MNNSIAKLLGVQKGATEECLGLYMSMTDIFFAQASKNDNGIEVKGLIRIPVVNIDKTVLKPLELNEAFFANYENWVIPLKKVMEKKNFKEKKVVVSLSPSFSILRHFVIPFVERKYWKQSIPLQARKYIHFPFEKAIYSYHITQIETAISKQKKLSVVFAMTSDSIVKHLTAGLKSIGLELAALELSVFSEERTYRNTDKEAVGNKGRIYSFFGPDSAELLFVNNNMPVLFRDYEFSGPLPIERRKLDVSNLVDFISKQLERDPFEEVVALGSNLDEWKRVLEDDSKKMIRTWDIKEAFGFSPNSVGEIAAIGACSKLSDTDVPDVDLLKNNRMNNTEASAIITLWKVAAIVLVACLGWIGFSYFGLMKVQDELNKENRNQVTIADFRGMSPDAVLNKVNSLERKQGELNNIKKEIFMTPKLVFFADAFPEDMWITKLDISDPFGLRASGKTTVNMEGVIEHGDNDVRADMNYGDKFVASLLNNKEIQSWCAGPKNDYPIGAISKDKPGTKFVFKCEGR